ncbi:MAG: rRNA maturation RNase YbeY [Cryomorphaceae bacterium]|nr:rRNA maturation RNase YbeY [Cryomorphaceae bacterium]
MAVVFEFPKTSGFSKKACAQWLIDVAREEGATVNRMNYKALEAEEMIALNKQFLDHNYNTDIITFSDSNSESLIEADFAIGWTMVKAQSAELNEPFLRELHRILVHGLLHCLGYDDLTPHEAAEIRLKEEEYLTKHPECSTWSI